MIIHSIISLDDIFAEANYGFGAENIADINKNPELAEKPHKTAAKPFFSTDPYEYLDKL